ncbi:MAG TPA: type III pantothenate kinase [Pelomicrobium sp.]|nr:type III pantothenate kinase [Pelomicrobium sp.]
MMLVLDIGNTRVKWGVREGGRWRARGTTASRPLETLPARLAALPGASVVAYSNVAGSAADRAVAALAAATGARRVRIVSQAAGCGVRNGYADPRQLGSDRWAALVAAWSLVRGPAVVVNAGTAATVDLLDGSGNFIGGIICPGIGLMLDSLQRRSRVLRAGAGRVRETPPRNTADAMQTGAVLALAGAIEAMVRRLEARCGSEPRLVLSGGDAPLLKGLGKRTRRVNDLVLEGVALLANEALRR